jgi:hypothetical protein
MKTVLFLVAAVAIFFCVGQFVPFTNHTALLITILGSWGAIPYKGLVAFVSYVAMNRV